jgi:hypothetical protein
MNSATRTALVLFALLLCGGGMLVAHRSPAAADGDSVAFDPTLSASGYELVASGPRDLAYGEFESIILHHSTVKSHHGRIEFGSVKMDGANAVVQVLFFDPDKQMQAFLYVLAPANHSWKVENVRRIWFVHLVRGLRT